MHAKTAALCTWGWQNWSASRALGPGKQDWKAAELLRAVSACSSCWAAHQGPDSCFRLRASPRPAAVVRLACTAAVSPRTGLHTEVMRLDVHCDVHVCSSAPAVVHDEAPVHRRPGWQQLRRVGTLRLQAGAHCLQTTELV